MTNTLDLSALRAMDYAVARAIGCSVVGNDTAMYSTNRYAALDALQHYAWLHRYRALIATDEQGHTSVSFVQAGTFPQPLLKTVANVSADRFETAIVQTILQDVARRERISVAVNERVVLLEELSLASAEGKE